MITQITINGKEHPFCYGLGAHVALEKLLGNEAVGVHTSSLYMMWACMFNGDRNFPYDVFEFCAIIDSQEGLMYQLEEAMRKQRERFGKPASSEEGDDKKKD